jgi:hypothetical protein
LGRPDRIKVYGESNVVLDVEELDHPAVLKEIGGVADCQNRLTAQRVEIGCYTSALGGTNECKGTPSRFRGAFQAQDANRLTIEPFIRREVIQRMPKGILAHDADVESLAVVDGIGGSEANEFSKIEEIGGLHSIFRHPVLSAGE